MRTSGNGGVNDIHTAACSGVRTERPFVCVPGNGERWEADEGSIRRDGVRLSVFSGELMKEMEDERSFKAYLCAESGVWSEGCGGEGDEDL